TPSRASRLRASGRVLIAVVSFLPRGAVAVTFAMGRHRTTTRPGGPAMDFSIPGPTRELLDRVAAFVAREVEPLEPALAAGPFAALAPRLDAVRDRAREEGLWAPQLPRDLGGMGLGFLEFALVGAALGRSPLGHFAVNAQAPDAGNMELLREFGTPEQQE